MSWKCFCENRPPVGICSSTMNGDQRIGNKLTNNSTSFLFIMEAIRLLDTLLSFAINGMSPFTEFSAPIRHNMAQRTFIVTCRKMFSYCKIFA